MHDLDLREVFSRVDSEAEGLSSDEAQRRLEKNGPNSLASTKKKTLLSRFLSQFKDVMILVLIAAAAITAVIAILNKDYTDLADAGIILVIVLLNAVIGTAQESKAEAALDALKALHKPYSKVRRDGRIVSVKSEELVVGDVVILEAGDVVPADLRLIAEATLKVEESALTGESVPVEKDAVTPVEKNAPLGDRKNMAFSGGTVVYGRGEGVVVATGMGTETGKIAGMLLDADETQTPLKKQLAKTAKILSIVIIAVAVVIFAVSLLRHMSDVKNVALDSFMTAVAIAVAAIPEGLPAIVTVVLALGVQRMSKKNAIIRHLPAVETLGCCQVICTDKTGTLTMNRMTVKKLYLPETGLAKADAFDVRKGELLLRALILCNDSAKSDGLYLGDPTETALADYADERGVGYERVRAEWRRVDELPFDSVRKRMTTYNERGDERIAYVKGATDLLLDRCAYIYDGSVRPITEADKEAARNANQSMMTSALRVLGAAIQLDLTKEAESDLVFVGLVGMIDPPRKEVAAAVAEAVRAGIRPVMITGDHVGTASAIGKEIGILTEGDEVMTGTEIDAMDDEAFLAVLPRVRVFARVSPENKVRIVKAYKRLGSVVAMTGDGVNDAPSIKEADIGVGMGITGTEVSKGAADMILTDDNFATIVGAVEEGRKIYGNIAKAIQFLLSANIAEVLCLFIATVIMDVRFLTPVMILWVNMITDSFPALSLGLEKAEDDVMNQPPRNAKTSLFHGATGRDILLQGLMQTGIVMLAYCMGAYVMGSAETGMTMAFVTLCVAQLFHSFNMKSQRNTVFTKGLFRNVWLDLSFLAGAIFVALPVLIPALRPFFGTSALSGAEWGVALACGAAIVPMVEAEKAVVKLVQRKQTKRR